MKIIEKGRYSLLTIKLLIFKVVIVGWLVL